MGLFESCAGLLGALSPLLQNGKSPLGQTSTPSLPYWIGNGGSSSDGAGECPWGSRNSTHSNPYSEAPNTGVTRYYNWDITRGKISPDGYEKDVILINQQFPGPLVEANWGDWIEVKVTNKIDNAEEGTAIHWHGFLQEGTPFMDGVPGVSQCPIIPKGTFTYRFRATLYGTSWYHSHYSAQYSGGLFGPLVVHGPNNAAYDIDVGPILTFDWWHKEYFNVVKEIMAVNSTGRTFSDNNLIQGKMNFNCSAKAPGDNTPCVENAGIAKFNFKSGKTHRLRFINSGSQGIERISIDEHTMTVIANDFVEIKPYDTKVVTIGVGQRVDVIVKADSKTKKAFWLRANLTSCSGALQPFARAAIFYDNTDENSVPESTPWSVPDPNTCANDALEVTEPSYPIKLPEPSWTQNLDIGAFVNASGNFLWTFGGVSARVDYNKPTLLEVNKGNLNFDKQMNVLNFAGNSSVRLIINNPTPAPHPIHSHGLNMYVVSEGNGTYNGRDVVRASNPMRRDVQNVRPGGYIVVQVDTTNAGVWPFHCHIAWHASGGFFSQFIFDPEGIKKMKIPDSIQKGCDAWNAYTTKASPNQIDSGL